MRYWQSFWGRVSRPSRQLQQLPANSNFVAVDDLSGVPDWRRPAAAGYVIITLTFVLMGGWSAVAKLDSAVTATGMVEVESNRKTVQHLEGGIVKEILVREGQHVTQGEALFRLDETQPRANLELQQNQLDFLIAQEARLIAERDGAGEIAFPDEIWSRRSQPQVGQSIADQVKQFDERRASLEGQISIHRSKIDQYKTEIEGLKSEQSATGDQLKYIVEELKDLTYLLDRNLVQKSRVLSLDREKSRLEGIIGRSIADQAKAEGGIGESQLQIRELRQKFLEDATNTINDVRQKLSEVREKVRVAKDVLHRLDVLAPVSGTAQNLRLFTQGGVVRAGEPLVDIVPEADTLIVQAHVSPNDIDTLVQGMQAEIRFSAFHTSILPIITGKVSSVSRDRLVDDQTKQPYFLARVIVEDAPSDIRERLTAGMPADIVFPSGERTVLSYLVRPLKDRMRHAMREK